jgi:hypothetical protein
MNKMRNNENLSFTVKVLLPLVLGVIVIFFVILSIFPTFGLTLEEFTFIYWLFSIVAFPTNYQCQRWTDYQSRIMVRKWKRTLKRGKCTSMETSGNIGLHG